jgi:hypothetical protein
MLLFFFFFKHVHNPFSFCVQAISLFWPNKPKKKTPTKKKIKIQHSGAASKKKKLLLG